MYPVTGASGGAILRPWQRKYKASLPLLHLHYLGEDACEVGHPGAVPQQHPVGQGPERLEPLGLALDTTRECGQMDKLMDIVLGTCCATSLPSWRP